MLDDKEGFVAMELLRTSLVETLMSLLDVKLDEVSFTVLLLLWLLLDEDDLDTGRLELVDDVDTGRLELLDDLDKGRVELLDDLDAG